jgi:RNA polymerase sigma factor (sigma-70 family)
MRTHGPALQPASPNSADALEDYLGRIRGVGLLTADEEIDLAWRIEAGVWAVGVLHGEHRLDQDRMAMLAERSHLHPLDGGPDRLVDTCRRLERDGRLARQRLVEANLRLVVYVARRYANRGVPLLDLVQEGNIGLLRAVDRFDHTRGLRFSTYATWWIRQAIHEGVLVQKRSIRLPAHMAQKVSRVSKARHRLAQELGREPAADEMAQDMGLPPETVRQVLQASQTVLSLDTPVGTGDAVLGDLVSDGHPAVDAEERILLRCALRSVLASLRQREWEVVRLRFGLSDGVPRTLAEVAEVLRLSRQRIGQIEVCALDKLRESCASDALARNL